MAVSGSITGITDWRSRMGGIIHISNIAAAIPRKMGHRDRDRLYSVWSNSAAVQELHCTMDHGTDKTEIAES